MAKRTTIFLPAGYSLTITADALSSGHIAVLNSGASSDTFTAIAVSTTTEVGPFNVGKDYVIQSDKGELTYSLSQTGFTDQDTVDIDGGTIDGATLTSCTLTTSTMTGTTTNSGTISGGTVSDIATLTSYNDNATSRRLKGLDFGSAAVQNYEGIFYNNSYDTWGALKTRLTYGSNASMDLILQASNDLLFLCTQDGDSGVSDIKFMTHTDSAVEFHFSNDLTPNADYSIKPTGIETLVNVGTAATNVTAVEYGDGHIHKTVLTVTGATLPAITGGAAEAEGVLLYTLPAGAVIIDRAYMSLSITQSEGNINADTPDVGLGTVIATGAVATLDGTATFENILTGQTAADANGTATVKTVANQVLVIETGDAHTVHFNAADTWAASGDSAATVDGTVVLYWSFVA